MTRLEELDRLRDVVANANGRMRDIICLPDGAWLDVAQRLAAEARGDLSHAFAAIDALIAQEPDA